MKNFFVTLFFANSLAQFLSISSVLLRIRSSSLQSPFLSKGSSSLSGILFSRSSELISRLLKSGIDSGSELKVEFEQLSNAI